MDDKHMYDNGGCCRHENLSEELWMQILSYVPVLEILQSCCRVSKSFHRLVIPQSYWLFHAEALLQDTRRRHGNGDDWSWLERIHLNDHQLQRLCILLSGAAPTHDTMDDNDDNDDDNNNNLPAGLYYGSRLMNRSGAEAIRQRNYASNNNNIQDGTAFEIHRRRVCLASSTDNPSELLENVLSGLGNNHGEFLQNLALFGLRQRGYQKWWSSKPSRVQDSTDTLLFTTDCPLAVLSHLKWRPLLDPFTRRQTYTWHYALVKAYRLPLHKLDPEPTAEGAGFPCTVDALPNGYRHQRTRPGLVSDENNQSTRQEGTALKMVLEGETPVFESPRLPYTLLQQPRQNRTLQRNIPWQHLVFPPSLIANVVTVTLVGKNSRQFSHSGFYACVEQVRLEGIPLLKTPQEAARMGDMMNDDGQPQQQQPARDENIYLNDLIDEVINERRINEQQNA
ncbi:expressed unknown protein [Seminavis robusta]|uniref:F-box domain-containing protein n=1 Tax=Seminavis robusta TaxID=568900 RepID=A0A9N8DJN5_9STRA|nr:expressed unknown protein [Seminavis robusta]|eukprot:Sro123_g059380.1 n/a (451) ;mRNA; r:2378-3834